MAQQKEKQDTTPEARDQIYRASVRNIRISPRKVRLVVNLIRGKNIGQALGILDNTNKRSAPIVKTLLKSAVANAEQKDENIEVDSLVVKKAFVDAGQTLKRWRPRAMGRATPIRKRTSRITLMVG
ncbi:MAG: 50S ribosomal protein L22 [Deltaproteobacteria bacterium]|nr:50S ribosomal protein L22 [Deltaproteobacteria bacterium]